MNQQWDRPAPGRVNRLFKRPLLLTTALAFVALAAAACGGDSPPGNAPESTAGPAAAIPAAGAGASSTAPVQSPPPANGVVPDFELPRAGGGTVRLSDAYSNANTVLVFYRGYF